MSTIESTDVLFGQQLGDDVATDEAWDRARVGGKASQLAALVRAGCRVPAFAAIPVDACAALLAEPSVQASIDEARQQLTAGDPAAASATARAAVGDHTIDDALHSVAVALISTLGDGLLAVRSSGADEDGTELSYAGQFDTVLGVRGVDELVLAVRRCWGSGFTERALQYRQQAGLDPFAVSMAVVVQRMVDSLVSGVLFTADPNSGDPQRTVISATWGLGEALVSGAANADTFSVDRVTGRVTDTIADKDIALRLLPDGGTEEQTVADADRELPCLTEGQVRELVQTGEQIVAAQGQPQDIEWAIDADGRLHVLQTRPITSRILPRGERRVWDNSNIVESFDGVVSPLTYSFAREAYDAVYAQTMDLLRVPDSQLPAVRQATRQMIGYMHGRVYYNLGSWYFLLSVLPGYDANAGAMEQMMGVREGLDAASLPPASTGRKLRVFASLGWRLTRIRRDAVRFRERVRRTLDEHEQDFSQLSADELVTIYDGLRGRVLADWREPIVNDIAVMIAFDRLRKLIDRWGLDAEDGTLHNDLMSGQGDVESAMPTHELVRMAEHVRAHPQLLELVSGSSDEDLAERLDAVSHDDSAAYWLGQRMRRFVRRFGDRCANELKLETLTIRERPEILAGMLRGYVDRPDITLAAMLEREIELRESAERTVRERLAAGPRRRFRSWAAFRMIAIARNRVKDREGMRFDRTRVFGVARRVLAQLGVHLAAAGLLDDPRDVFLLEVEEIIGTVQGTCTTTNLRGLVALRRTELDAFADVDVPDRFRTVSMPMANPLRAEYAAADVSGDSMQGIGCCAGVVERPAHLVRDPAERSGGLGGDIMVCERTDPGWVPLFPSCGGLLVERGSLLSHSAIVAREFGIPAVVGIPGLRAWIRDGETVRLDGATGRIDRVSGGDERAEVDG